MEKTILQNTYNFNESKVALVSKTVKAAMILWNLMDIS